MGKKGESDFCRNIGLGFYCFSVLHNCYVGLLIVLHLNKWIGREIALTVLQSVSIYKRQEWLNRKAMICLRAHC